jgi:NADH-quinone oxidoreductase subunit M
MLPHAALSTAIVWMVGFLGMFSIIYGAFCALHQKDFKKLVAYSSVSHMGFVLLGLAAFSHTGVMGAVLQMFTHGLSSAMMFLIVGVIYDRAHHRNLDDFGGLGLQMPWYTGIATIGFFASLGLPGLCGFISEALTFVGAWDSTGLINSAVYPDHSIDSKWMIIASLLGVVLTAAYILWTIQRVYLGTLKDKYKDFKDVTDREVVALVPLAILCVLIGVFPHQTIISHITPSLQAMTDMVRTAVLGS